MAKNSGKAKTGYREQLFAIASSEALCNGLGRERIKKANIRPLDQGIIPCPSNKRPRSNLKMAREQPKTGFAEESLNLKLLDILAADNSNGTMEVDLAEECEVAINIKKFLGRGLLDGWVVTCYSQSPEKRDPSDVGTSGEIAGSEIKCFCQSCCGIKYWSTTQFEVHAGCKKKHPAENFYLHNGKTIRDVMNKCKLSPLKSWEDIVSKMLDSNLNECTGGESILCSSCLSSDESARSTISISSSRSSDGVSSSTLSPEQVNICDQKLSKDKWFCGAVCTNIQSALQNSINGGEICLPQHPVDNIQRPNNIDVKWRLLRGYISDRETKDLLRAAVCIFHERFNKIIDGKGPDLVPLMVYGRSSGDLDFHGMYSTILTVDTTVVCAAIFRIFGDEVAELPLVAVKTKFEGQGYFQSLFYCIEDLLRSLKVKKFLLPAAKKVKSMWINRFDFNEVTNDKLNKYEDDYPITRFRGSPMLHKDIS